MIEHSACLPLRLVFLQCNNDMYIIHSKVTPCNCWKIEYLLLTITCGARVKLVERCAVCINLIIKLWTIY